MTLTEIAVARINARQVILVALITGASGVIGALIQAQVMAARARPTASGTDSTVAKSVGSGGRAPQMFYELAADMMERELQDTLAPGDARHGRSGRYHDVLRQAVFRTLMWTRGDAEVVAGALDVLIGRGHLRVARERQRILTELPGLVALRIVWLEGMALPGLEGQVGRSDRRLIVALPAELRQAASRRTTDTLQLRDLSPLRRELVGLRQLQVSDDLTPTGLPGRGLAVPNVRRSGPKRSATGS